MKLPGRGNLRRRITQALSKAATQAGQEFATSPSQEGRAAGLASVAPVAVAEQAVEEPLTIAETENTLYTLDGPSWNEQQGHLS